MQTHDLNGSMGDEAPLHAPPQAPEKQAGPESGLQNCERADRCCLCMPIKFAMCFLSL